MHEFWSKYSRRLAFLALSIVVIFATLYIVDHYISRNLGFSSHRLLQAYHNSHGKLSSSDSGFIRSWMTFDYVNNLFKLPSDYLKAKVGITDTRYPKISIRGYASSNRISESVFLADIQRYVSEYVSQ